MGKEGMGLVVEMNWVGLVIEGNAVSWDHENVGCTDRSLLSCMMIYIERDGLT